MYLLKRIVNFGGSSNENSSGSDPSKAEPIQSENLAEEVVQHSNKNKKKKRRKTKTVEPIKDDHKVETDEDEKSEEVHFSKNEIPDQFYDDLSETDPSKTGNSTTEDISSSDLSDNQPLQKTADVDFWAEHQEDEMVNKTIISEKLAESVEENEKINFDDFWADFDKHDGQIKKDESSENIERPDHLTIDEKCEEGDSIDNFWSDKEDDLPPITEIKLLKKEAESIDINQSERDKSVSKDSLPDDISESRYRSESKEKSPGENEKDDRGSSSLESENSPERNESSDQVKSNSPTPKQSSKERSLSRDSVPDASVDVSLNKDLRKSKSKSSTPSRRVKDRSMSRDTLPEVNVEGSLEGGKRKSKSKSSTPNQNRKESLADGSRNSSLEKENSPSKSSIREKSKSKSKSKEKSPKVVRGKSQSPTSDENELLDKEIKKSESKTSMSSQNNEIFSEENPDMANNETSRFTSEEPVVNNECLEDKDNNLDNNENNDKEKTQEENEENIDISETKDDTDNVESFWNDSESDIPPVFTLKALKKNDEVSSSEHINKIETTESSTESVDASENTSIDKIEATESSTESVDASSANESDSDEKETTEEVLERTKKKEEKKEIDKFRDEKESHRRSFAKALQDIEAPVRRRSVLVPDNRERVSVDEQQPPLPPPPSQTQTPRSHCYSESSTDGEASHDDGIMDFLGKENDRAEARLAARRQARVEAREIRMRELERVQKEQEETGDKVFDLHSIPTHPHLTTPPHMTASRQPSMSPRERPTSTNSYHSSRRSSEDSMEDGLSLRDIRHELKEVEEKFRKAMIANAQLDNEKAALAYQVELLKDKLEDLEELHSQLGKEHRERCREHEALKRAALKLKEELVACKMYLEERDILIADYGLIIVGGEIDEKGETTPRALVSSQSAQVLESAGEGSLDVRLKTLFKEKNDLVDEVRHLKLELEEERNGRRNEQTMTNGPLGDEIQQTLNDYRFRLQKAEQDTSTLQATVARLESQVIRYKSAAEESEKAEDELKQEKRKLLREHRESIARIEELETSNSHLQRRMDKLKNAKSTLLKEL